MYFLKAISVPYARYTAHSALTEWQHRKQRSKAIPSGCRRSSLLRWQEPPLRWHAPALRRRCTLHVLFDGHQRTLRSLTVLAALSTLRTASSQSGSIRIDDPRLLPTPVSAPVARTSAPEARACAPEVHVFLRQYVLFEGHQRTLRSIHCSQRPYRVAAS